jgi:hypothetical protein
MNKHNQSNDNTCGNYVTVLNGNAKLIAYDEIKDKNVIDLNAITDKSKLYDGIGPQEFNQNICINTYSDLKLGELPNYLNGNLIILSGENAFDGPFANLANNHLDEIDIFNNLVGINGSLCIIGTAYKKINGFSNLKFIRGNLIIINNSKLTSISIFPSLISIGQKIIIANNPLLSKIIGFEEVQNANGVYIMDNDMLTDICGFINLLQTDNIIIESNLALKSILGFCYIETIKSTLSISCNNQNGNENLFIDAFHYLESIGGLVIHSNHLLEEIHFKKLHYIIDLLKVSSNIELIKIKINSLVSVGDLIIENNSNLNDLKFKNLSEITASLIISNNKSIESLNTFEILKRIGHSLLIIGNELLETIGGFNELKFIGNKIYQLDLNATTSETCPTNNWITIFPNSCEIDNSDINIVNSLTDFNFKISNQFGTDVYKVNFSNECVDGQSTIKLITPSVVSDHLNQYNIGLMIYSNPNLVLIKSFHVLKSISGHIYFVQNPKLEIIHGFNELTNLLDLHVRNNPLIESIKSFESIVNARDIIIAETIKLKHCDGFKKLRFAQHLYLESANENVFDYPKYQKLFAGLLLYHNES